MTVPMCGVCTSQAATYVCQKCGRPVCKECINTVQWSCRECESKVSIASQEQFHSQISMGMILISVAFAIIFLGMSLMALGSLSSAPNSSGSLVILVGPIPIFIGNGPDSTILMILAVCLTVVSLAFVLLLRRRR